VKYLAPFNSASQAIVTSDTLFLAVPTDAIYVGGGGDVTAIMAIDPVGNAVKKTLTFKATTPGSVLPLACWGVQATGTTATNMIALYSV
jgi:hypothetical protein